MVLVNDATCAVLLQCFSHSQLHGVAQQQFTRAPAAPIYSLTTACVTPSFNCCPHSTAAAAAAAHRALVGMCPRLHRIHQAAAGIRQQPHHLLGQPGSSRPQVRQQRSTQRQRQQGTGAILLKVCSRCSRKQATTADWVVGAEGMCQSADPCCCGQLLHNVLARTTVTLQSHICSVLCVACLQVHPSQCQVGLY
jgi:hypothetical protein